MLSICIPVYNKWNFTKSCLNDLCKLSNSPQIVIVDNGTDETSSEIQHFSDKCDLLYLKNEINTGFAKSVNKAFCNAKYDNILFLNNDIRVRANHNDWTNLIEDAISSGNNLIGPTGGFVDPKQNFKFCYETNSNEKKINYMSGWCLAASKTVWNKLIINNYPGPFSEEFFCYFEDTDLGFRATELEIGFKIISLPVTHFGKTSSSQLNTYELYSNARKIFCNKWNNYDFIK